VQDIADTTQPPSRAMLLLNAGIPLSLLIDLCTPGGLDSRGINEREHSELE
jgi:hypothetical protein